MEELGSLFVGVALLILLAAASLRYGVDSRDGFSGRKGELARGGILWDASTFAPSPPRPAPKRENPVAATPADCGRAPRAA